MRAVALVVLGTTILQGPNPLLSVGEVTVVLQRLLVLGIILKVAATVQ
jgi:hypothetical protein